MNVLLFQQCLAQEYYLDIKGSTICKVWRGMGLALSLSGDDATMFHPTCERFAPPLPSAEQLTAVTGAPPLPTALAPDPDVGPAQARNADRKSLQSGEEEPSHQNELAMWLVAE